jgi:Tfp pilus assembly protein PilO
MRAFSHAVVALLGAALPLSFYLWLVRPDRAAAVERAEQRLDARQKELQALAVVAGRFDELQREQRGVEERLARLEEIRPASRETGPLLDELRGLAAAEGLSQVSVEEVSPAADTVAVPIRLRAEGSPKAIAALLGRVPRLARLVRVERIELDRRDKGGYGLVLGVAALRAKPSS